MWRCVRRMSIRAVVGGIRFASLRMPVPASRITREPSLAQISTVDVLPPYRVVSAPGAASDPRVPKRVTRINPKLRNIGPLHPRSHHPAQQSELTLPRHVCAHRPNLG